MYEYIKKSTLADAFDTILILNYKIGLFKYYLFFVVSN
jgi:hypothetical protein